MSATAEALRDELKDAEYSQGYAESFLDSFLATQIKVLREQNGWTQEMLAERIGTKQGAVSRIEDVNYSKWNVSTLKKLARAFRLRLKVSFETYGSLLAEVEDFSRSSLQRQPREKDAILYSIPPPTHIVPTVLKVPNHGSRQSVLLACRRHNVFVSPQNKPGTLQESIFGNVVPWHFSVDLRNPVQAPIVSAADVIREATI